MDTFAVFLCAVFLPDMVEAEVLLRDDLDVPDDLEDLEDLDGFDVAVDTTELYDDLLCRRWDNWSKALIACNLEELERDIKE